MNVLRKYLNGKSCMRALNPIGKGNPGRLLKIESIHLKSRPAGRLYLAAGKWLESSCLPTLPEDLLGKIRF